MFNDGYMALEDNKSNAKGEIRRLKHFVLQLLIDLINQTKQKLALSNMISQHIGEHKSLLNETHIN